MTDDPLEIVTTGEPFRSRGFRRTWRRSSAEVGGAGGGASTVSPRTDRIRQKRRPRCPTGQATTGTLHSRGGGGVGCAVLVLPRQLTHHFEQSFVLLFELLVLVLDVVQVLHTENTSTIR